MWRLLQLFQRFQGAQSGFSNLPGWARIIVMLAALPGILLIALSLLALGVSILALLLLAVPSFRFLSWITGARPREGIAANRDFAFSAMPGVTIEVSRENAIGQDVQEVAPGGSLAAASDWPAANQAGIAASASPPRRHVEVKIIEE